MRSFLLYLCNVSRLRLQRYAIFREITQYFVINFRFMRVKKCFHLDKSLIMNDLDIKEIRAHLGITQAELAKRLGVSERTVQNWESGTTIPESKHALLRGLKPQTYFGGNVEQTNVMGNNNIQGGNAGFTAELSKLVELLAAKETSLQNAQAHIDRLLAIIDNLTKQQ